MANEAYALLEDTRSEHFISIYRALKTDQERMNWLVDMSFVYGQTGGPGDRYSDELDELVQEFFSPRTESGEPDHETFASRIEAFHQARMQNRVACGRETSAQEKDGLFPGSPEKTYVAVMRGDLGAMNQTIEGIYIGTKISPEYRDVYADRIGIKKADVDKYMKDHQIPDSKKEAIENELTSERFEAAFKISYLQIEENYKTTANEADKQGLQHYYTMEQKTAGINTKTLFTNEEGFKVDQTGNGKCKKKVDQILEANHIDDMTEVKGALAQFNTKRSSIFRGRESKEHAELREAAENYVKAFEKYQQSIDKSPEERLVAMAELQGASKHMARMAEDYEDKKGTVNTPAGLARLRGAMNLKLIGQEMEQRIKEEQTQLGHKIHEYEESKKALIEQKEREAAAEREKAEKEQQAMEQRSAQDRVEWKDAVKTAGEKGKDISGLNNEMEAAWKSGEILKTGSKPDKQLRSAIGALDLEEKGELPFSKVNYDNPSIVGVQSVAEAAAQVIAIQSIHAQNPERCAKGVSAQQLQQEMKAIQERPGFKQMMENYEKVPGSLTALARNDPSQLWQEMLRTEQKILTGQDPQMEPRKPVGRQAYPHQTHREIAAMKEGKTAVREANTASRKPTNVAKLEQKFDMKAPEKKAAQKHKAKGAAKQNEMEGPEMGGEDN